MRFWILLAAFVALTFQPAYATDPPAPTLYTFGGCTKVDPCPDAQNAPQVRPRLGLDDTLTMQVNGTMPEKGWSLLLDGSPLTSAPKSIDKSRNTIQFKLQRTSENRDLWARLLGRPMSRDTVDVRVSLELNGHPLNFVGDSKEFSAAKPNVAAEGGSITLKTHNNGLMVLGMFLAVLVVALTIVMARNTSLIRDGIIPQLRPIDRSYSLGRTQMAFWFCLVLICFIFIAIVTYDIHSITQQGILLMGIAAGTALGAAAVDQSKDNPRFAAMQAQVAALGIADAQDVVDLANAAGLQNAATAPAATVIANAAIGSNANPTVKQLWEEYLARTADARSDGFVKDLMNDINGPTIHRWQIVVWTLVLGGIYLISVYTNLAPPDFDTNLLALMGISGATYVGFKIPEKQ